LRYEVALADQRAMAMRAMVSVGPPAA